MSDYLFDPDEKTEPSKCQRCTPELLRAFILRLGHSPTMGELRAEFGGIIGPILDGHELQKRGMLPRFKPLRRKS